MTRQRRDPADKAQEALDIARRKVAKICAKQETHTAALRDLAVDLIDAEAVADYLAEHPLLATPEQDTHVKEPTA